MWVTLLCHTAQTRPTVNPVHLAGNHKKMSNNHKGKAKQLFVMIHFDLYLIRTHTVSNVTVINTPTGVFPSCSFSISSGLHQQDSCLYLSLLCAHSSVIVEHLRRTSVVIKLQCIRGKNIVLNNKKMIEFVSLDGRSSFLKRK